MPLPRPKKGESKDDFRSRCMSSAVMKREYPKTDQRLAVCDSQFKRRNNEMPQPTKLTVQAKADVSSIRTEELDGERFTVVPVVALVEGVLHPSNAAKPELALASEFGKFDGLGWNGRPIVLNHPERDGLKVSANSPGVLKEEEFGQMFNAKVEDKKLKAEMWLNQSRISELDGNVRTNVDRLLTGEHVEVSTGLFAEIEQVAGVYNDQDYFGIWRNVVPDHLAILEEGVIGACSVEDGCGAPRTNSQTIGACEACQAAQKPCDCAKTTDTYWINYTAEPKVVENQDQEKHPILSRLLEFSRKVKSDFKHAFTLLKTNELSDNDTRVALEAALAATMEGFSVVIAVFNDQFVFGTWEGLFMQEFSIAEDGAITLGDEAVPVRPVTNFVPVSVSKKGERDMSKAERVNALIANKRTRFTENDKDWLLSLEESNLEALEPVEETPSGDPTPAPNPAPAPAASGTEGDEPNAPVEEPREEEPVSLEAYIGKAPVEIQAVLNEAVKTQSDRRTKLVEVLKNNARCEFSEDELKAMSLSDLERLAKMASPVSYIGNGGANNSQPAITDNETHVPAPAVFSQEFLTNKRQAS